MGLAMRFGAGLSLALVVGALGAGCGTDSEAPNRATVLTATPLGERSVVLADPAPADSDPSPGEPAPEGPASPLSDYQRVDTAVQAMITRDAEWQAPAFLTVGRTDNIALTIGDAHAMQAKIDATVPTVQPRAAIPVTIGPDLTGRLSANASDADISPLEAQNWSVGEQTRVFFAWQVKPLIAGELNIAAYIECQVTAEHTVTQIVPLRIPVHPAATPPVSLGDRLQALADGIKSYWAQITFAAAGLGATARLGWGRYRRQRKNAQPGERIPASP